MLTDNKKSKTRRTCMECLHYRALIFSDTGDNAWCGKCTTPSPSGKRLRAARDAMSPACADFSERPGSDHGGR